MKTINCENCGKEMPFEASTCADCGHPNKCVLNSDKPQETDQDEDLRAALLEGLRDDGYRDED